MKYLFVLAFITGAFSLSAQDYIPFPDSVATWITEYYEYGDDCCYEITNMSFHLQGDTIIEGQEYSLLYHRHTSSLIYYMGDYSGGSYTLDQWPYQLIGGVREDSEKKVWFLVITNGWQSDAISSDFFILGEELMLFDFGLDLGDTVQFSNGVPGNFYDFILDSVNYEILGRRTLNFRYTNSSSTGGYSYVWVEGIGALNSSPFSRFDHNDIGETTNLLQCFSQDGLPVYHMSSTPPSECDTDLTTSLSEVPIHAKLMVYPNPTTGELRIILPEYPESGMLKWELKLVDALGRRIPESKFEILEGGSEAMVLNLESLPSGAYLLRLLTDKAAYSARILRE